MQSHVSIFTRIVLYAFGLKHVHGELTFPLRSDEFLNLDGLIVEIDFSKVVQPMSKLRLNEVVSKHRVKHRSGDLNAVAFEHREVVFQILTDLQNFLALEKGAEDVHHRSRFFRFTWN